MSFHEKFRLSVEWRRSINHVKHNLEYGYQLTGLIQSKTPTLLKEMKKDTVTVILY